ncbi:hypothetical protein PAMP_017698 [Pampus punctatissimus]
MVARSCLSRCGSLASLETMSDIQGKVTRSDQRMSENHSWVDVAFVQQLDADFQTQSSDGQVQVLLTRCHTAVATDATGEEIVNERIVSIPSPAAVLPGYEQN